MAIGLVSLIPAGEFGGGGTGWSSAPRARRGLTRLTQASLRALRRALAG